MFWHAEATSSCVATDGPLRTARFGGPRRSPCSSESATAGSFPTRCSRRSTGRKSRLCFCGSFSYSPSSLAFTCSKSTSRTNDNSDATAEDDTTSRSTPSANRSACTYFASRGKHDDSTVPNVRHVHALQKSCQSSSRTNADTSSDKPRSGCAWFLRRAFRLSTFAPPAPTLAAPTPFAHVPAPSTRFAANDCTDALGVIRGGSFRGFAGCTPPPIAQLAAPCTLFRLGSPFFVV